LCVTLLGISPPVEPEPFRPPKRQNESRSIANTRVLNGGLAKASAISDPFLCVIERAGQQALHCDSSRSVTRAGQVSVDDHDEVSRASVQRGSALADPHRKECLNDRKPSVDWSAGASCQRIDRCGTSIPCKETDQRSVVISAPAHDAILDAAPSVE
jgi:hypothetical protein